MFRELKNVTQHADTSGYRRWFWDEGYDLIVFYSEAGEIRGFQLCYDTSGREKAFTWQQGGAPTHNSVDQGEGSPRYNCAPTLHVDRNAPAARILGEFMARSELLDPQIVETVCAKLRSFPKAPSLVETLLARRDATPRARHDTPPRASHDTPPPSTR